MNKKDKLSLSLFDLVSKKSFFIFIILTILIGIFSTTYFNFFSKNFLVTFNTKPYFTSAVNRFLSNKENRKDILRNLGVKKDFSDKLFNEYIRFHQLNDGKTIFKIKGDHEDKTLKSSTFILKSIKKEHFSNFTNFSKDYNKNISESLNSQKKLLNKDVLQLELLKEKYRLLPFRLLNIPEIKEIADKADTSNITKLDDNKVEVIKLKTEFYKNLHSHFLQTMESLVVFSPGSYPVLRFIKPSPFEIICLTLVLSFFISLGVILFLEMRRKVKESSATS